MVIFSKPYITPEQYNILNDFGKKPDDQRFKFSMFYNGISNSCVDFVWKALAVAHLNPSNFQGDVIPTNNIVNIQKLFAGQTDFYVSTPQNMNLSYSQWVKHYADYFDIDVETAINSAKSFFLKPLGINDDDAESYQISLGTSSNDDFIHIKDRNIFIGIDGIDTISYANASSAIDADLMAGDVTIGNNLNLDGSLANHDYLIEVENIIGSNFNDNILGNSHDNILSGGLGNDMIDGEGGNDILIGGPGNDVLSGGEGSDIYVFNGNFGFDVIDDSGNDNVIKIDDQVVSGRAQFIQSIAEGIDA